MTIKEPMTSEEAWAELLAALESFKLTTEWADAYRGGFDHERSDVHVSGLAPIYRTRATYTRAAFLRGTEALYGPNGERAARRMARARRAEFSHSLARLSIDALHRDHTAELRTAARLARLHRKQYPSTYRTASSLPRPVVSLATTEVAGRFQLIPAIDVALSADLRHGTTTTALEQFADMLIRTDNVSRGLDESTDLVRVDVTDRKTRRITTAPDVVAFRGVARYARRVPVTYYSADHALTEHDTVHACEVNRERVSIVRDDRPITWQVFGPINPEFAVAVVVSHAPNYTRTMTVRSTDPTPRDTWTVTRLVTRETGRGLGFIGHKRVVFPTVERDNVRAHAARTMQRVTDAIAQGREHLTAGRPQADIWACGTRTLAARVATLDEQTRENYARLAVMLATIEHEPDLAIGNGESVSVTDGVVTRADGRTYRVTDYARRAAIAGLLTFTD